MDVEVLAAPLARTQSEEDATVLAKRHLIMHYTKRELYDEQQPRIIVRGRGSEIWDAEGNRFIDAMSGMFCVQIGYSYGEEIGRAVTAQLSEIPYYTNWSAATPIAVELAAKIASLAPDDLNRVFFTSSGSEANEAVIKLVRQYHDARGDGRRKKFIARRNAFHGTTFGAMSLNGITNIRSRFEPLMDGVRHISNTNTYRTVSGATAEAATAELSAELESLILHEDPGTIAGIIMEPVQNSGGCFVPPAGYPQAVRELCDKYGILLIADEVVTGFGRLGSWFGSELFGLRPDLISFAKGVTSGYAALGGVICSDQVFDTIISGPSGMYLHGGTFGGNPASCATALANINIIERDRLLERVTENGPVLGERLRELRQLPIVGDVRGIGYQYAIELVRNEGTSTWDSSVNRAEFAHEILERLIHENGIMCRVVSNDPQAQILVQLAPPLVLTDAETDRVVNGLSNALTASYRVLLKREGSA